MLARFRLSVWYRELHVNRDLASWNNREYLLLRDLIPTLIAKHFLVSNFAVPGIRLCCSVFLEQDRIISIPIRSVASERVYTQWESHCFLYMPFIFFGTGLHTIGRY